MKKRKLKLWVKMALTSIISIIILVIMTHNNSVADSDKEKTSHKTLHGVVEIVINGKAELTMIEDESMGVGETKVQNKNYLVGDTVTVIYDENGNIIDSHLSSSKERKALESKYGQIYSMLLEKIFVDR